MKFSSIFLNQSQFNIIISKLKRYETIIKPYLYNTLCELDCSFYQTTEHYNNPSQIPYKKPIEKGFEWGGEFTYGWFFTKFSVPKELTGKKLWLYNNTQSAEALLFIDGIPRGIFDVCDEINGDGRNHSTFLLTQNAAEGEIFDIALECYAGNSCVGYGPYDTAAAVYPLNLHRVYRGLQIIETDEELEGFILDLRVILQLYECLPDHDYKKWEAASVLETVYKIVPQKPEHYDLSFFKESIHRARAAMSGILSKKSNLNVPFISVCGHSHLDAAWLWPVEETKRKAARTFANALELIDRYDDYIFMQSSPLYLKWMKDYYPDIFERIKACVAKGRWDPNGGSWVEPDCNMPSGELLIRHFLRGQIFLNQELNYHADTFWLPDTFGYSAAIPQILKGFSMKYFLTTKLSWNDTTKFPYDSFVWQGIDGSQILTHFNYIHCWPDVKMVRQAMEEICQKRVSHHKLIAYGFGDGGGGPHHGMVEMAARTADLEGLPKCHAITVSAFMSKLEECKASLPCYAGELYLERHRGTFTQFAEIKRTNRKAEFLLRDLEMAGVFCDIFHGVDYPAELPDLYDILLLNQFHDILPGTAIPRAMEIAISENRQLLETGHETLKRVLSSAGGSDGGLTFVNSLSFPRIHQFSVEDNGFYPKDAEIQKYNDLDGVPMYSVKAELQPMGTTVFETGNSAEEKPSPFIIEGDRLETPYASVHFGKDGYIESLFDKQADRELRNPDGLPLGTLISGDDVPLSWDNWDIDADQQLKMKPQQQLLSRKVVSNGPLQIRIRSIYAVGRESELTQDMVFYSDSPRIDFDTVVDWRETHTLLKVVFDLNLKCSHAKTETQFGYIERPCFRNDEFTQAKFEVCNHKWTDLSEHRYGVALLNDCKYGISIDGSCMALTLLKSGAHPTPNGDRGRHRFAYALLPHDGRFSAETVVRPAYEFNTQPILHPRKLEQNRLLTVSNPAVIVEAVKKSEDGSGYIFRLYECEQSRAKTILKFGFDAREVWISDMMENPITSLEIQNGSVEVTLSAFEIMTLKVIV